MKALKTKLMLAGAIAAMSATAAMAVSHGGVNACLIKKTIETPSS